MKVILIFLLFALAILSSAYAEEAVITFTFDDGSETIFRNAFPLFAKYKFPATLYLVTNCIGNGQWCVDWNQIAVMKNYDWEIASHSHTHPHMTELAEEQIEEELDKSIDVLKKHGYEARSYASPYGEFDERVLNLVKKRFQNHRKSWGGVNGFNDSSHLNRYDISAIELRHSMSFEEVKGLIDKAVEERRWLVFLLHGIVKDAPQEYQFSKKILEDVLKYIKNLKIKVVTISDYLENQRKGEEE